MAFGASRGLAVGADRRVYEFPLSWSGASPTLAQPVPGVELAESVATFGPLACVVTTERRVVCWNEGSPAHQPIAAIGTTPTPIEEFVDAQAVVVTRSAVCARDTAGAVTCIGSGLRDSRERSEAVFPFPLPRPAIQIAGAAYAVCAVVDDGTLYCKGDVGAAGYLGGYETRDFNAIFLLPPAASVAMYTGHLCIRFVPADPADPATDVACAGKVGEWYYDRAHLESEAEEEETPDRPRRRMPVDLDFVPLTTPVTAIATSRTHACALTTARGLHCWGMAYRDWRIEGFTPQAAAGIHGVTELVSGGDDNRGYTCGIQGDLPLCFSGGHVIEPGTPGRPRFIICTALAADGTCSELRLAARAGSRSAPASAAAVAPNAVTLHTPTATPAAGACVVADASGSPLNVRDSPSTRAAVVGTLPNASSVTTDETSGRFRHLTTPLVGWAWADNLRCP
jgi:hypothetical protein